MNKYNIPRYIKNGKISKYPCKSKRNRSRKQRIYNPLYYKLLTFIQGLYKKSHQYYTNNIYKEKISILYTKTNNKTNNKSNNKLNNKINNTSKTLNNTFKILYEVSSTELDCRGDAYHHSSHCALVLDINNKRYHTPDKNRCVKTIYVDDNIRKRLSKMINVFLKNDINISDCIVEYAWERESNYKNDYFDWKLLTILEINIIEELFPKVLRMCE